jgi:hypothetical protein
MLLIGSNLALAQEPDGEYDPAIHVYREGLDIGIMNDNATFGTFSVPVSSDGNVLRSLLIPLFNPNVQPLRDESGSWFYPSGEKSRAHLPSSVAWNSCGGGDDAWAYYYYINENELWTNDIVVAANNIVSQAHIWANGGLNGGYYCTGGLCSISVCTTQVFGSDPGSVWISYNPG